jgi:hypothetical protein
MQFYISLKLSDKNLCNIGFTGNRYDWAFWNNGDLYDEKSELIKAICLDWVNNVSADNFRKYKCAEFTSLIRTELCEKLNKQTFVQHHNKYNESIKSEAYSS